LVIGWMVWFGELCPIHPSIQTCMFGCRVYIYVCKHVWILWSWLWQTVVSGQCGCMSVWMPMCLCIFSCIQHLNSFPFLPLRFTKS
jgi:F0F1-type ATP synthase assembly protein I